MSENDQSPAWPKLDDRTIAELEAVGEVRAVGAGEILYPAGAPTPDFFVVLEGAVEIVREDVREDEAGEVVVATHTERNFLGELNLLTGQRAFLTARVSQPGRVLEVPLSDFRRLMSTDPDFSGLVFRALVERRKILRASGGAGAIRIIGSRFSPDTMALVAFANRARLPHTWIDLEDIDDAPVFLASVGERPRDVPVVFTPTATLRNATPGEFAAHLGLTYQPVPGYTSDLVVVGTGPAGLSASVYGASEGPRDALARRGRSRWSGRRELAHRELRRFPDGVSGDELVTRGDPGHAARRAAQRALRGRGSRLEEGFHVVVLADESEVPTKAVIIATGAHYRRLEVDNLERFEGIGRLLRRDRARGARVSRLQHDRRRRWQLGRPGRDLHGAARQPRVARRPARRARSHDVAIPHRPCRGQRTHRRSVSHGGSRARGPVASRGGDPREQRDTRAPDRGVSGAVLLHRRRSRQLRGSAAVLYSIGPGSSSPTGPCPTTSRTDRSSGGAIRCRSRPRCRASSRSATCAADR